MIILGRMGASIYPNSGIMWENRGKIIFKGNAFIGNNSFLSTGLNAEVVFGDGFVARSSLKLVSYHEIVFESICTIGWDCIVMDTDFHPIIKPNGCTTKGYGKIHIGAHTWIANNAKILKNSIIPNYSVIAANTIVSKSCVEFSEYSVLGNSIELKVISRGWMDRNHNTIEYPQI